jgi:hypothetical protein
MANEAHLAILKKGVEAWNRWRKENPGIAPDLNEANLSEVALGGANLRNAKLIRSNLEGVNLGGMDLSGAELWGTNLRTANLSGADLFGANLLGANLSNSNLKSVNLHVAGVLGANLSSADLSGADLGGADLGMAILEEANLDHALMAHTSLGAVDLSSVKGLETVRHSGPSSIGIDTIYFSRGKIPEIFLRGAGVPEAFITYMKSLVVNPIEYYSCFISYSSKDEEFAKKLHRDLQAEHVRCWFAPEDLKIGDEIRPRIDEAIRIHDKLLIVLSENSVGSPWVRKEVETAFGKEIKFETEQKQRRTVLFPIRLDDAVKKTDEAWAADIRRTRNIGDFREWKSHDRYKEAFGRLMRDLKAEEKMPG